MKTILSFIVATLFLFPNGSVNDEKIETLQLNSENYIVYNIDTDTVVASKNENVELAGASINKVLTVLTALDYIEDDELDDVFSIDPTIFEEVAIEASVAGFYPNQRVTLRDVLYGVMLPSGADAAILLSYKLFDTSDGIVDAMNQKAKELGMDHTNIVNQIGLDDDGQHTTLEDLLTLLLAALDNPLFYDIYTSAEYTLSQEDTVLFDGILVQTSNYDAQYIIGAKSGYTYDAGRALSSLAVADNMEYLMISTQAEGDYFENNGALEDAVSVYDYLFKTYEKRNIIEKGYKLEDIKIKYKYDLYPLVLPISYETIVSKDIKASDISVVVNVDEQLQAPIPKGTVLATYDVRIYEKSVFVGDVVSTEEITADYIDQMLIIIPSIIGFIAAFLISRAIRRRLMNR